LVRSLPTLLRGHFVGKNVLRETQKSEFQAETRLLYTVGCIRERFRDDQVHWVSVRLNQTREARSVYPTILPFLHRVDIARNQLTPALARTSMPSYDGRRRALSYTIELFMP
jgi:hypothetical protein